MESIELALMLLPDATINTIVFCTLSTLIGMLAGTALAYVHALHGGTRLQFAAVVSLMSCPPYVLAFTFLYLFDYSGVVMSAARSVGLDFPVRNIIGLSVVKGVSLVPAVFFVLRIAFLEDKNSYIEVARSFGATRLRALWDIWLPMKTRYVVAAAGYCVVEGVNDFGTVSMFSQETLSTVVYRSWTVMYDLPLALWLSIPPVVFCAGLYALCARAKKHDTVAEDFSPYPMRLVHRLMFVLPTIPVFVTVACALMLVEDIGNSADSAYDSMILALYAAVPATIGLLLYRESRATKLVSVIGYAIPGTVLGLAVYAGAFYTGLGTGLLTLGIAYTIKLLAFADGTVSTARRQIPEAYREMSADLGATPLRTFFNIDIPLCRAAYVSCLLMGALEILQELPITLLLRPVSLNPLAVRIYEFTSESMWVEAAPHVLSLTALGLVLSICIYKR